MKRVPPDESLNPATELINWLESVICPQCEGEFVAGVEVCADCGVALVTPEPSSARGEPEPIASGESWVVLLKTGRLLEADLAASTLEEAGIPHYRQEQDSSGLSFAMPLAPSSGPGTWWVIQVPEAVAEEARSILEQLPITTEDAPGVWDFGPTEQAKSFFKRWALASLVLFALVFLLALMSLIREF